MKSKSATQHKPSSAKTDTGSVTRRAPTKLEKCLMTFLVKGLAGVHTLDQQVASTSHVERMEAAGKYWTSCLNSDVSEMRKRGISIHSRFEPYRSRMGHIANFKRYWLADGGAVLAAIDEVNCLRSKRGALTLSKVEIVGFLRGYLEPVPVSEP